MMANPDTADQINNSARSAEQDAISQICSNFNSSTFGITNSGEVIDKNKTPKVESKQLTAQTWTEIVEVL